MQLHSICCLYCARDKYMTTFCSFSRIISSSLLISFGLFKSVLRRTSARFLQTCMCFTAAYVGVHTSINLYVCMCHVQQKHQVSHRCVQTTRLTHFYLTIGYCCGLLLLLWPMCGLAFMYSSLLQLGYIYIYIYIYIYNELNRPYSIS